MRDKPQSVHNCRAGASGRSGVHITLLWCLGRSGLALLFFFPEIAKLMPGEQKNQRKDEQFDPDAHHVCPQVLALGGDIDNA